MTRKVEYPDAKLDQVVFVGEYSDGYSLRPLAIFCRVVIKAGGELSISGVESPYGNGDCGGSCGQIDTHFAHRNPADNDHRYADPVQASAITFAAGWNADKWLTFLDIWEAHHLNMWARGGKTAHPLPLDVIDFLATLPKAARKPAWI